MDETACFLLQMAPDFVCGSFLDFPMSQFPHL